MSKEEKKPDLREHWLFQATDKELNKVFSVLGKLFGIVRGKIDLKSRLMLLANPENIKTSTILTAPQVEFATISAFVAKEFDLFNPLDGFAEEFKLHNISKGGIGREQQIRFVGALQETRALQKASILVEKGRKVEE